MGGLRFLHDGKIRASALALTAGKILKCCFAMSIGSEQSSYTSTVRLNYKMWICRKYREMYLTYVSIIQCKIKHLLVI